MLLRRVSQHVKDQNWFAVLVDFVIVVIGVFIGIQVSNWNDARTESEQEKEILANIIDDVRTDVQELADGIRMAKKNIAAANYTLVQAGFDPVRSFELATENATISDTLLTAPVPQELPAEQTERLWSDMMIRYHPTQSDTAFNTLLATGRLGLIKDKGLVQKLQAYRRSWADIEVSQNTTFRPFRNRAVFVGQKSGLSPFTKMPEAAFVELVKQDPELLGAMKTMQEYAIFHRDILEQTLALAEALLLRLDDRAN